MITKQGYVFIAELTTRATPIFGEGIDEAGRERGYDNIIANNLTFFNEEEKMREVMNRYSKERKGDGIVKKMTPANLAMQVAESAEELDFFKELTDLVAIHLINERDYSEKRIYGPINKKFMDLYHGVIPAHRIDLNGLLTFKRSNYGNRTFEVAMEARYQLQRQSDNTPTTIGTFKLKKLKQ